MKRFCTECSEKIMDGNNFCTNCGKPAGKKQTEQRAEKQNFFKSLRKKKLFVPVIAGMGVFIVVFISFFVVINPGGIKGKKIKDGIVEAGGISIKADIANGEAALRIEKASDIEVENGAVTDVAVIEYKEIADKDVTVSIPVDEKNDDKLYMMGIGTEVYNRKGNVERIYRYYDAKINNNIATITFNLKEELEDDIYFSQTKNSTGKRPKCLSTSVLYKKWAAKDIAGEGHFRIIYPQKYKYEKSEHDFMQDDEVLKLMNVFEDIYDVYINDYDYEYKKREAYPLDIIIEKIGEEDGFFRRGVNIDYAYITINSNLFWAKNINKSELDKGKISDKIKSVFAHEFFHFVQANYYNPYANSTWFGEATASYFEGLYMPGFMDSLGSLNDNWKKVYQGLFPSSDSGDEGYARMPLIEFWVKKKDKKPDFIRQIYKAGSPFTHSGWTEQITKKLGMKPNDYVVEFYCDLLMQKIRSYKSPDEIYYAAIKSSKYGINVDGVCTVSEVPFPEYNDIKDKLTSKNPLKLTDIEVTVPSYGAKLVALDMLTTITAKNQYPDGSFLIIKHSNECEVKIIEIDKNAGKNTILTNDEISDIKKKIGHGYTYLLLVVSLKDNEIGSNVQIYVQEKDKTEKIDALKIIPDTASGYQGVISKVLGDKGSLKTIQDPSDKDKFIISVNGASVTEKGVKPKNDEAYTTWSKNYKINSLMVKGTSVAGGECSISANISYKDHSEDVEKSVGDYFNVEEYKISDSTCNVRIEGTGKMSIMQTYDKKHGNYKKMTMVFDSVKTTGTGNYKKTYKSIHPDKPELNKSEVLSDNNYSINSNEPVVLSFVESSNVNNQNTSTPKNINQNPPLDTSGIDGISDIPSDEYDEYVKALEERLKKD